MHLLQVGSKEGENLAAHPPGDDPEERAVERADLEAASNGADTVDKAAISRHTETSFVVPLLHSDNAHNIEVTLTIR